MMIPRGCFIPPATEIDDTVSGLLAAMSLGAFAAALLLWAGWMTGVV